MSYVRKTYENGAWVIHSAGTNIEKPKRTITFAFDTETFVYLDGKIATQDAIFAALNGKTDEEKRKRISTDVWSWQCYDEHNGFFMTNDFDQFLLYQCRCRYKFGWCYNAKFDFSQIDFKILAERAHDWKPHVSRDGKAYNKGQPWAFESLHNDMGARYAYKLWVPYKNNSRHTYTHAIEYRDFMNIFAGGLKRVLKSLDVRDLAGDPIRKLEMDYQSVDPDHLTAQEIAYCENDVKGLYFAIKKYNDSIEDQSIGEKHIFGKETNVCTAGGFAKSEILRSMYPDTLPKYRIKKYQKDHPISVEQDKYFRDNHLYRGGICYVNPRFRGKLLTKKQMGSTMQRYDVNSEYPFAMYSIRDLVGHPRIETYRQWLARSPTEREEYEAILILKGVSGKVKRGYMGLWYDPKKRDYVDVIDEDFPHLIFEREMQEFEKWYELEYLCDQVILYKRGEYAYRPFVDRYYKLKNEAKKDGNVGLQAVSKLCLNSGYGKLAERVERTVGKYVYDEEKGAIRFKAEKTEIDAKSIMSVAVGALITCVARIWIMSHIREICNEAEMSKTWIYVDTDSVHAFNEYDKADPYTLGGFKLEARCEAVKYIAPKTYFDVEHVGEDGKIKIEDIEVHTKGINVRAVKSDIEESTLTLDYLNKRFHYGQKFVVLCAMNVKGGKALIPIEKYLADWKQAKGSFVAITNYDGQGILSEV